jgi:hypothetical protein
MEEEFVKVYSAGRLYNAELVKGLLLENNIEASLINKRNSELLIGEIEIYVPAAQADKARKIIDERD